METDISTPTKQVQPSENANTEHMFLFTEEEMQNPAIVKTDPIHSKSKENRDKLTLQSDSKRSRKGSK